MITSLWMPCLLLALFFVLAAFVVLNLRTTRASQTRGTIQTPRLLFLVIPGNPGLVDFYDTFLHAVHEASGGALHCQAIGHAGHAPSDLNQNKLNLDQQIQHKLAYIRQLVSREPDLRLVLAGHSVGAYICLHLARELGDRVLQTFLLFPTVANIGSSPNGVRMTRFFSPVVRRAIAASVAALATLLPPLCLSPLIRFNLGRRSPALSMSSGLGSGSGSGSGLVSELASAGPSHAQTMLSGVLRLLAYRPVSAALFMADDEMRSIRDLEAWGGEDVIRAHLPRMVWYFGARDDWCPLVFARRIQDQFPAGRYHFCDEGLPHAFCVDEEGSRAVARRVWEWTKPVLAQ